MFEFFQADSSVIVLLAQVLDTVCKLLIMRLLTHCTVKLILCFRQIFGGRFDAVHSDFDLFGSRLDLCHALRLLYKCFYFIACFIQLARRSVKFKTEIRE